MFIRKHSLFNGDLKTATYRTFQKTSSVDLSKKALLNFNTIQDTHNAEMTNEQYNETSHVLGNFPSPSFLSTKLRKVSAFH